MQLKRSDQAVLKVRTHTYIVNAAAPGRTATFKGREVFSILANLAEELFLL